MDKTWLQGPGWDCPSCGSEIEILTDAHEWTGVFGEGLDPGAVFWDGDDARCPAPDCDWEGSMWAGENSECGVSDGNVMELDDDGRLRDKME